MKKIYFIIINLSIILSSCEKVIDVDLNDAEPVIVVEGYLTDIEGMNYVLLSKSNSFYTTGEVEKLEGAEVEVVSGNGISYKLDEEEKGYYRNQNLKVETNQNYKLNIRYGSTILQSVSNSPSAVKIDSIEIMSSEFSRPEKELYRIICHFRDSPDEVNFYRLRLFIGDDILKGFYVMNDKFLGGESVSYPFDGVEMEDNSTVRVELLGVDESNYEYFYTLSRIMGMGQDIIPGNPPTNIEGDAIGIFGANTFDSKTVVFKKQELD
ncbi:MAG: DUF4249 domain-containing protein [Bacteroidota bacterium]